MHLRTRLGALHSDIVAVKLPSPYPCMRRRVALTVVGIVQLAFACLVAAAGGYRLYDLYHNKKPSVSSFCATFNPIIVPLRQPTRGVQI